MSSGDSSGSNRHDSGVNDYRRRALEIYRQRAQSGPLDELSCEEALEELRVHQIEIELQNQDLRRAREEAETARDTYFLLFEAAPTPYLVVDEAGSIRRANLKATEVLETDRSALTFSIQAFFPAADASVMEGLLGSAAAGVSPQRPTLSLKTQSAERYMEVTVAPWEGDNAAPSQSTGRTFLVSLTDVTDRKLREDEQARSVERYRRLLREMSHRIKNNLQVLSSIVEIERGSGATGESFRRIAERIRNVSRVHNALYEATTEVDRIDLAETLLDFIRQYRGGLPHNVELTYEPPDRPLHTDSLYGLSVSLAVNELLTNAVQHAFPDGRRGHISVSLGKHKEGVVLIVSDDGVGMTDKGAHGSGDTARGGVGTLLVGQLLDEIGARWTRTSEDGVRHEITFQLQ